MNSSVGDAAAPLPRICHLQKTHLDQEYGFNLHAEVGRGQYIGSVDYDSPAEKAGLQQGDRIVAVNGVSVEMMSHKEVVAKIKDDPSKCALTVIDEVGEQWYRDRNLAVPLTLTLKASTDDDGLDEGLTVVCAAGKQPLPRLCKLIKSHAEQEYGFNLHAERNRGHFIGQVDLGSVGRRAQLEEGQRIVGVNGTLVFVTTSHKEVVRLIKQDPLQVELLVASPEVDNWYRTNDVQFSFSQCEVVPNRVETVVLQQRQGAVEREQWPDAGKNNDVTTTTTTIAVVAGQPDTSMAIVAKKDERPDTDPRQQPAVDGYREQEQKAVQNGLNDKQPRAESKNEQWTKLTAAEMRLYLQRNKKSDPRSQQLSMEKKYQIAQNL